MPFTAIGYWPLYDMIAIPIVIIALIYGYYKIKKIEKELSDWKEELDSLPDHDSTVSDFEKAIDVVQNEPDISEKDKAELIKDFQHEISQLKK